MKTNRKSNGTLHTLPKQPPASLKVENEEPSGYIPKFPA